MGGGDIPAAQPQPAADAQRPGHPPGLVEPPERAQRLLNEPVRLGQLTAGQEQTPKKQLRMRLVGRLVELGVQPQRGTAGWVWQDLAGALVAVMVIGGLSLAAAFRALTNRISH